MGASKVISFFLAVFGMLAAILCAAFWTSYVFNFIMQDTFHRPDIRMSLWSALAVMSMISTPAIVYRRR